jgi:hypothetical protein
LVCIIPFRLQWLFGTLVRKLADYTSPILLFFHFSLVKDMELIFTLFRKVEEEKFIKESKHPSRMHPATSKKTNFGKYLIAKPCLPEIRTIVANHVVDAIQYRPRVGM